ncbi:hypothetical protein [Chenggangzhangella methanolivorans]|uniref:Uncharacterized protein n=1 Tax=Chenggangzhangella methanolivorans TaxID=1437009 RepID=A0A9E6RB13_9HYPH|nr:hypothetical protein [Chenggangzhangella methanolivorans]QZO01478.1 hypothetical protein K6K41_08590 [Chenggangzhangella methanolivorans]
MAVRPPTPASGHITAATGDHKTPLPLFNFWPTNTNNTLLTGPRTNDNAATYNVGTAMQSIGNPNYPMLKAFADTCAFWDEIGRGAIEKHDLALSLDLKNKIADRWGAGYLYSPKDDPELLSALTSFSPFPQGERAGGARPVRGRDGAVDHLRDAHAGGVRHRHPQHGGAGDRLARAASSDAHLHASLPLDRGHRPAGWRDGGADVEDGGGVRGG